MKILFYFQSVVAVRGADLSYTSLEKGSGFSGTETALLELSKYLVDNGHSVQIYGGTESSFTDNNIIFISINEPDLIDYDVDWYSPLFFFDTYQQRLIEKINSNRTKIFLWFHCFISDNIINHFKSNYRLYAQYVSKYVADSYTNIINTQNSWIVYNGINKYFTTEIIPDSSIKKGNWIFSSSYERGGSIAKQIFTKVNVLKPDAANKLNMLSYYTPHINDNISTANILNLGSKTKIEVRDFLLLSDYFVYPLVLTNGSVHHDTFGSCMLEALACGTIVIVWDVACISSVYSDYVVKISVPNHIKQHYDPQARFASCNWMLSDEAQQLFIDKILELESDIDKKELIRKRGVEWACKITWETLGAYMENELLTH